MICQQPRKCCSHSLHCLRLFLIAVFTSAKFTQIAVRLSAHSSFSIVRKNIVRSNSFSGTKKSKERAHASCTNPQFYRINYLYVLEKVVQNFQKQNVPEMSYNYKKCQRSHFDPSGRSRYTSIVGSSSAANMDKHTKLNPIKSKLIKQQLLLIEYRIVKLDSYVFQRIKGVLYFSI